MAFDDDGINEHYFAITRAHGVSPDYDHELRFTWPTSPAQTPILLSTRLAGVDQLLAYYYPSVVAPPWTTLASVGALRAGNTGGSSCQAGETILEQIRVNRSTGAQSGSNLDVDTVHSCVPQHRDMLAIYDAGTSSTFEACWTVESSGQDDLYCDDRLYNASAWQDGGSPGVTTVSADATDTEDHSWLVVEANGTLRVGYHHNDAGGTGHNIEVFRQSTPSNISVDAGGFFNFPSLARTTGVYHLTWHDITTSEVYHSRCGNDAGDDCEDPADWDASIVISATGHDSDGAQVVVRASKVVVFYDDVVGAGDYRVWTSYSSDGGVTWCKQAVDGSQGQREEIGLGPYGALPAVALHEDPDAAGEYEVDVAYVQDHADFGGGGANDSTTHVTWASADLDDFVCAPTCDGATVACTDDEDCDRLGCCDRDGCGTCNGSGYCTAPP